MGELIMKKLFAKIIASAAAVSIVTAAGTGMAVNAGGTYEDECVQMLNMINEYRAENGVKPLKLYITACNMANTRSAELVELFDHTRPNGTDCFTIFEENNINCGWVGENIAFGYGSVEAVMNAWMNSEGHRSNILDEDFEYIGIGIINDRYWTQLFLDSALIVGEKGDVNGDGEINSVDASNVLNYYAYQATYPQFVQLPSFITLADVDGDSVVNATDASSILRYYAEKSTGGNPTF